MIFSLIFSRLMIYSKNVLRCSMKCPKIERANESMYLHKYVADTFAFIHRNFEKILIMRTRVTSVLIVFLLFTPQYKHLTVWTHKKLEQRSEYDGQRQTYYTTMTFLYIYWIAATFDSRLILVWHVFFFSISFCVYWKRLDSSLLNELRLWTVIENFRLIIVFVESIFTIKCRQKCFVNCK